MSIYKQNIDPIALTEADADEFLRDMDITLYEDTIMIEGTEFEGTYGESILEANGIFLYEDGIVLEGKQADEYKARKAAEKEDNKKKEIDRARRRSRGYVGSDRGSNYRYGDSVSSLFKKFDDDKRDVDRHDKAFRMIDKAQNNYKKAAKRHYSDAIIAMGKSSKDDVALGRLENRYAYGGHTEDYRDEKNRLIDSKKKHDDEARSSFDKGDYQEKQARKASCLDVDVYGPVTRHLKNQERINRSKKPKNESTIFSDIDII